MSDRLEKDVNMNIFGFILGQNIIMLVIALLLVLLGLRLLMGGWVTRLIGLVMFPAAVGWSFWILLPESTRFSVIMSISMVGLIGAAVIIWQNRSNQPQNLMPGRPQASLNKSTVFAGILLVVVLLTAVPVLLDQARVVDVFAVEGREAERAAERSKKGFMRVANALLVRLDDTLAR